MASKLQNLDFVLEQLDLDGVTSRKMFGEYAIYYRDRIVALFCDDQLFIKPTNAGRAWIGRVSEAPPYPGAKPWYFISGDRCEDGEWLSELVRVTASELPPPKPKTSKAKSSAASSQRSHATAKKKRAASKTANAATKAKRREKTRSTPVRVGSGRNRADRQKPRPTVVHEEG